MKNSFWKLAELLSSYSSTRNVASILVENSHLIDHFKSSPDGKHSALAIACEDRRVLAIVDNQSRLPTRTFDCGSNNYIQRFEWLSNEEVAFTRSGENLNTSPHKPSHKSRRKSTHPIFVGVIVGGSNSVIGGENFKRLS